MTLGRFLGTLAAMSLDVTWARLCDFLFGYLSRCLWAFVEECLSSHVVGDVFEAAFGVGHFCIRDRGLYLVS